jgi:hypothetical protein
MPTSTQTRESPADRQARLEAEAAEQKRLEADVAAELRRWDVPGLWQLLTATAGRRRCRAAHERAAGALLANIVMEELKKRGMNPVAPVW